MKQHVSLAAFAAAALLVATAPAAAQDVSGMWEVSWESPRGARTFVVTLAQPRGESPWTGKKKEG